MATMKIGNYNIQFDEIRRIKSDVQLDDQLKNSLAKDGLDEVVFRHGDDMFIAYKSNADFDNLKLNADIEKFSIDDAYNPGQLSLNGDAVQVLFIDDENKDSFWTAPIRSVGDAARYLVNQPLGKSFLMGMAAGAAGTVALKSGASGRLEQGIILGALGGTAIGGLKAGAERDVPGDWNTGLGLLTGAAGLAAGAAVGGGGHEVVTAAIQNPKTAAITVGVAATVVGTGIALDFLDDNSKPANYRTINRISVSNN